MSKLRTGYRVLGPDTSTGKFGMWYHDTLGSAKKFAQHLSERHPGVEIDVVKYVGSCVYGPWIPATDLPADNSG